MELSYNGSTVLLIPSEIIKQTIAEISLNFTPLWGKNLTGEDRLNRLNLASNIYSTINAYLREPFQR